MTYDKNWTAAGIHKELIPKIEEIIRLKPELRNKSRVVQEAILHYYQFVLDQERVNAESRVHDLLSLRAQLDDLLRKHNLDKSAVGPSRHSPVVLWSNFFRDFRSSSDFSDDSLINAV